MSRDLRLLPAAALGWVGCLVAVRATPLIGSVLVVIGLLGTATACVRLMRPPGGRHRRRTYGRAAATVLLTAVAVTGLTGWSAVRSQTRAAALDDYMRTNQTAELRVDSEPRTVTGERVILDASWLAVESLEPAGRRTLPAVSVTVLAPTSWDAVVVGSRVQAAVRVAPTERGDPAAALLVVESEPAVLARAPPIAAAVASLRAGLLSACADLDAQAQGLVPGIAVGDDRALPVSLADDLRTVSLTHVTAVSGAHVAMVLGIVLAGLARLRRPWRAGVGAVVLVGLVVLVHPTASVLRSAAMGAVLLVGLLLGRPRAALPALWTSVLVLLAADPWLSTSFGFVLSVLATAGLLLASGPLTERFARVLPKPLAAALAVPVAAQLACLPALALLQPQLPVHGVLANVLAAPAIPPATVLGLLATLVHPVLPGVSEALAAWAGIATAWVAAVATWCADLPLAGVSWWFAVAALAAAALLRARAGRTGFRSLGRTGR